MSSGKSEPLTRLVVGSAAHKDIRAGNSGHLSAAGGTLLGIILLILLCLDAHMLAKLSKGIELHVKTSLLICCRCGY